MCEISDFFGMMDKHHASIEQMKCTAGILYSFGVTDLCSYYSLTFAPEAEIKPMEFGPKEYRRYTEFATRLNAMFTAGSVEPRVALLYPIVSLWSHFTPSHRSMYEPHPNEDVRFLDGSFTDLCRSLLQQQIDFDVVDERSLAGARTEGKSLIVGNRRYDVLLLPPADTLRLATMEAIVRHVEEGGSVLAHPLLPAHAAEGPDHDNLFAGMMKKIKAAGALGGSAAGSPPIGYLIKSRLTPACNVIPASPNILCTQLLLKEGPAFFIVNVSSAGYTGTWSFRVGGKPYLYDPSTGDERALRDEKTTGTLPRVSLDLKPFESVFVLFR
jgi:hypothetical protein